MCLRDGAITFEDMASYRSAQRTRARAALTNLATPTAQNALKLSYFDSWPTGFLGCNNLKVTVMCFKSLLIS